MKTRLKKFPNVRVLNYFYFFISAFQIELVYACVSFHNSSDVLLFDQTLRYHPNLLLPKKTPPYPLPY